MDGLCPSCGRKPAAGKKRCQKCLDKANAWSKRNKPWKRRVRTNRPWKDRTLNKRVEKWRKKQVALGNCKICGKKAYKDPETAVVRQRCAYHLKLDRQRMAKKRKSKRVGKRI